MRNYDLPPTEERLARRRARQAKEQQRRRARRRRQLALLAAIEAAGSGDPAAIAEALPSVTYTGVTGSISFDENGDANKDMAYIKKANTETGAFDFEKTQTVASLEK